MNKKQVTQRVKELIKEAEASRGPLPKLVADKKFQAAFVDAVVELGDNGNAVRQRLASQGITISHHVIHRYMRKVFGSYAKIGRPSKYLNEKRQSIEAS